MMLDCRHASQLISQSMEKRLGFRQRIALRIHLMMCDACTQFSRQMELLRLAIKNLGDKVENDQQIRLSDEARERIRKSVQHTDQNF